MPSALMVQMSYPKAQCKTQLPSSNYGKKHTRVVIRGPLARTVRAEVIATT